MAASSPITKAAGVLAGAAAGSVASAATGGIPQEHIYTVTVLAAVVAGVAGLIAWIDARIDSRVGLHVGPLRQQVDALYNHFIMKSNTQSHEE